MSVGTLDGLKVLVLEDQVILALEVTAMLEELGARVLGPYHHAEDALSQLDHTAPDCGLIDINLGYGPDFEPARHFMARNLPFAFLTAYGPEIIPAELRDRPIARKPVFPAGIVAAVQSALGAQA